METNTKEVADDLTEDEKAVEAFANTEFDAEGKAIETKGAEEAPEVEEAEPEESEEVEEVKPEAPVSSPEIKVVEGETPRERALRAEVTRVKREKRELMQENILLSKGKTETVDWKKNVRERGYSDDQIEEQEKLQDDMALAKGFVSRADLEKKELNSTFENFLDIHPDYKPENDKDDARYSRFIQILKSDYNLTGKTQAQIKSVFDKVHRDIVEEFGEVESPSKKINAQKEKINAVSIATSNSKSVSTKSDNEAPKKLGEKAYMIGGLKFEGFDEEDFK